MRKFCAQVTLKLAHSREAFIHARSAVFCSSQESNNLVSVQIYILMEKKKKIRKDCRVRGSYCRILTSAFRERTCIFFPLGYTVTFSPTCISNLLEFPATFVRFVFFDYFCATANFLSPESARETRLNFSRAKSEG